MPLLLLSADTRAYQLACRRAVHIHAAMHASGIMVKDRWVKATRRSSMSKDCVLVCVRVCVCVCVLVVRGTCSVYVM